MRKIVFGLLVLASLPALAQQKNAAFFEIGGSAVIASVNYERRLGERVFGRAGLMVVEGETEEDTESTAVIPLTVSWISHPQLNHHLELGGGVTVVTGDSQDLFETADDDKKHNGAFGTAIIGYRYQKPGRGFQFRAALTPLIASGEFQLWPGFSFGYAW